MKYNLIKQIHNIENFHINKDFLFINSNTGFIKVNTSNLDDIIKVSDKLWSFKVEEDIIFTQEENGGDLKVYDENGKLIKRIEGKYYLAKGIKVKNKLFLRGKDESGKSGFEVDINTFKVKKNKSISIPTIYKDELGFDWLGNEIFAFNISSGKRCWNFNFNENQNVCGNLQLSKGILVIPVIEGEIPFGKNYLLGIDTQTGKKIWELENTLPDFSIHPKSGLLYGYGGDRYTVIEPSDGKIILDKEFIGSKEKYQILPASNVHNLYESGLYFTSNTFGCKFGKIDIEQDEIAFVQKLDVKEGVTASAPVYSEGKLYVLDSSGTLHVFERDNV